MFVSTPVAAILEIKHPGGIREVTIGYTATIGRHAVNDVAFPDSPLVSRQHAILRCHQEGEYQIVDLGSRNGTYVNDARVVMPATLHDQAIIRVGGNEILFCTAQESRSFAQDDVTLAAGTHHGDPLEVAILVCDIRGFSGISETLPPAGLAMVLGNWFREAGNLVQRSGGVIDKFIGDALLAYWIDVPRGRNACVRALQVADEILSIAGKITWPLSELPFEVGIALHHGTVNHGNIGLVAQRDATIIGDAVNTAFRLEGVMKSLGLQMVLSEEFSSRAGAGGRFEDFGDQQLKGKSKTVRVFGMK